MGMIEFKDKNESLKKAHQKIVKLTKEKLEAKKLYQANKIMEEKVKKDREKMEELRARISQLESGMVQTTSTTEGLPEHMSSMSIDVDDITDTMMDLM